MVDMEDDVVAEGLVVFTSVLDELVVSWVVEVGPTVAVGDAFFVAVIGVPVVDVPSLDAVLLTTAFADVVATMNLPSYRSMSMLMHKHVHVAWKMMWLQRTLLLSPTLGYLWCSSHLQTLLYLLQPL